MLVFVLLNPLSVTPEEILTNPAHSRSISFPVLPAPTALVFVHTWLVYVPVNLFGSISHNSNMLVI